MPLSAFPVRRLDTAGRLCCSYKHERKLPILLFLQRMQQFAAGPWDEFDKDAALGRVGGDIDLLKEIARLFLDDCPRSLTELREAAARNDCSAVERSAHTLKGASANFGATRLVSAALDIEKMGHAGTLDNFVPALVEVESALDALRAELEVMIAS